MSEKYKTYPGGTFFVTLTVCGWVNVFNRSVYAELIFKSLNYCIEHKGLKVYAWVLMSNHLHMVAESEKNLGDILRDFKSFTSKEILKAIAGNPRESRKKWLLYLFRYFGKISSGDRNMHFWQDGNHPIALEGKWFFQKVNYIHFNPVKAGIVSEPEHYIWSSAHPFSPVILESW
jgi:REP element-mobilizing transposase RayT